MSLEKLLESILPLSDVTLIASNGERFRAHKAVLSSCSAFFLHAFEDLPDSAEIRFTESAEVLKVCLSHIYDNCKAQPITLEYVRDLVAFFSKYDVPKGLSACGSFLTASAVLGEGNLRGWLLLADKHKFTCFLEKCVKYAASEICLTDSANEWMVQLLPSTLTSLVSHPSDACKPLCVLPASTSLSTQLAHVLESLCCSEI